MIGCSHRLGYEDAGNGPVCVREECHQPMCRNCKFVAAAEGQDGDFCTEACRTEYLVAQAESRESR